jgi:bis(5'-nucleosyl)-tetraphosphatase (symmetrical)
VATYAIGDVQGCFRTLERLLRQIRFDDSRDRLWLVGDLVNRGPRSLAVLRWARRLGQRLVTVLGNHDLHLIGVAFGLRRERPRDTLAEVLRAHDREDLVEWLRSRPLVYHEREYLLVHAGLHPEWTAREAVRLAREAEHVLQSHRIEDAIGALREEAPGWSHDLSRKGRLRIALQTLTGLRTCKKSGRPCSGFSGPPEDAPRGCRPWFEVPGRRSADVTVVCGHWAALGIRIQRGLIALDTGCVWGRRLTALRLEDRAVFQEPFAD